MIKANGNYVLVRWLEKFKSVRFAKLPRSGFVHHQNEKSKPRKKDLPLLENDIPNILVP